MLSQSCFGTETARSAPRHIAAHRAVRYDERATRSKHRDLGTVSVTPEVSPSCSRVVSYGTVFLKSLRDWSLFVPSTQDVCLVNPRFRALVREIVMIGQFLSQCSRSEIGHRKGKVLRSTVGLCIAVKKILICILLLLKHAAIFSQ